MADAWAYARVEAHVDAVRRALPDLVGSNGARLTLREGGEPMGPPVGAVQFAARWHDGRSSGEADVLIFPVSSSLSEVHVSLRSAWGLGWPPGRLARLACELAGAVAAAASAPAGSRRVPAEGRTAAARWMFVSATGGSSSR